MSDKPSAGDADHPSDVVARSLTTSTEPRHHHQLQRGFDNIPSSSTRAGRFGRMFRSLPTFELDDPETLLGQVAERMTVDTGDPGDAWDESLDHPSLPAGYTYLGQFIDHDITFDPVSSLERQNDPDALHNFRTPRYDLDSVYGQGPADQPYLYRSALNDPLKGIALLLGETVSTEPSRKGPDLPRNSEDVALLGDPRNDENLIVSQLHSVMLRFHNRVVEGISSSTALTGSNLFKEAQRIARWHYQWVVVHDFLVRIAGKAVVDDILDKSTPYTAGCAGDAFAVLRPKLLFYKPDPNPYMPVEFSVSAYRFGHSLIRPSYAFNAFVEQASGGPTVLFSDNPDPLSNLNGFRTLPPEWGLSGASSLISMPTSRRSAH